MVRSIQLQLCNYGHRCRSPLTAPLLSSLARSCARSSSEWTVKQVSAATTAQTLPPKTKQQKQQLMSRDSVSDTSELLDTSLTVANLRRLLSRMIATNAIALTALPRTPDAPCLSYTDFLACYVALLSLLHAGSSRA